MLLSYCVSSSHDVYSYSVCLATVCVWLLGDEPHDVFVVGLVEKERGQHIRQPAVLSADPRVAMVNVDMNRQIVQRISRRRNTVEIDSESTLTKFARPL